MKIFRIISIFLSFYFCSFIVFPQNVTDSLFRKHDELYLDYRVIKDSMSKRTWTNLKNLSEKLQFLAEHDKTLVDELQIYINLDTNIRKINTYEAELEQLILKTKDLQLNLDKQKKMFDFFFFLAGIIVLLCLVLLILTIIFAYRYKTLKKKYISVRSSETFISINEEPAAEDTVQVKTDQNRNITFDKLQETRKEIDVLKLKISELENAFEKESNEKCRIRKINQE